MGALRPMGRARWWSRGLWGQRREQQRPLTGDEDHADNNPVSVVSVEAAVEGFYTMNLARYGIIDFEDGWVWGRAR